MKNIDKIFDAQIASILKELQQDKALIRMYIKNKECNNADSTLDVGIF